MPRALWPHVLGRPVVEVVLPLAQGGRPLSRILLADTGAGQLNAPFELVLQESDCLLCGGFGAGLVALAGAYTGTVTIYVVRVQFSALAFDASVRIAGVSSVPAGFDGIACFPFLNRFTFGNFGDPGRFGLET